MKTWAIFLSTLGVALAGTVPYALSDEFIAEINSKQSTWIAGRNFDINTPWSRIKKMASGSLKKNITYVENFPVYNENVEIPEYFDARENWPNCESIKQIRDQSGCGACWAFAAVSAMSDRICIATNGKHQLYVSAEDLNSCCSDSNGCNGGFVYDAWDYWNKSGIVTGGLYNNTQQGCKSYSFPPCEHHMNGSRQSCTDFPDSLFTTPACTLTCDDPSQSYENSKTYGLKPYFTAFRNATSIQLEILTNGPVEGDFLVYEDFLHYKSGVYQHTTEKQIGVHAVKIMGWGVENGVNYWLTANSWNADWGENGYFKIIRGINECEIEGDVAAALPDLDRLNSLFN